MVDLSPAIESLQNLLEGAVATIPNLIIALVVFAVFYVVAGWVHSFVRRAAETTGTETNASLLLGRLARWGVLILGFLVALSAVSDLGATELIGVLGIAGVAIGFAFQDIFENFLAGLLILLTQPFRVGDQIVVSDYEGTVEDIQTRATIIKTYDNRRVVIPNADVFTDSVVVDTAFDRRRSQYDVGIGYDDDIGLAKRCIYEALDEAEGVLDDPAPDVLVVDLASSSVNLRVRWWTDSSRGSVVRGGDAVIAKIKAKLDTNGVDIPYAIRTVYFHNETEQAEAA